MRVKSSWVGVSGGSLVKISVCAYDDVVFCELVVEVVYADFASVASESQRFIRFALLFQPFRLLVRCTPGWCSSVVGLVVFVTAAATTCAVFFIAIVYPVTGPRSAGVQNGYTFPMRLTHRCRISRLVCSVSPEVGVSSCSSFVSAAAGRYRRLEWHGGDAPELEDVARERGLYGSRRREMRHLSLVSRACRSMFFSPTVSLTFLTPSLGPSSLRGPRGGGGARLSGLRPPPLAPPRCCIIMSRGSKGVR
jgi:hypothetical protein